MRCSHMFNQKQKYQRESCSCADKEASTLPHSDTHSHSAAMQEGNVTYASVQFKKFQKPPAASASASASAAKKQEETVYDEVKVQRPTTSNKTDTGEGKAAGQSRCYQILAWCAGSLCVLLLLLAVIVLVVHKKNNTDLTRGYAVLEKNNTDLSADIQMLKATNINFTKQIEKLKEEKRNLTFTVAQETIDDYCPKTNRGRQCVVCPGGWMHNSSSCYGVIDTLIEAGKKVDRTAERRIQTWLL
ncbi:uncharacterized protein LOC142988968 isoform X4 [Genypterus blacodes]|uniref:uncharacterized protein LOC142988968 isoform X4 n=1 Tax=Genypterus blacodes TaxID=154954 RepID=UPI003F767C42